MKQVTVKLTELKIECDGGIHNFKNLHAFNNALAIVLLKYNVNVHDLKIERESVK